MREQRKGRVVVDNECATCEGDKCNVEELLPTNVETLHSCWQHSDWQKEMIRFGWEISSFSDEPFKMSCASDKWEGCIKWKCNSKGKFYFLKNNFHKFKNLVLAQCAPKYGCLSDEILKRQCFMGLNPSRAIELKQKGISANLTRLPYYSLKISNFYFEF